MRRPARYAAAYVLMVVGVLACLVAVPIERRAVAVIGVAAAAFLSTRVVRFVWRDFYLGRRLQAVGGWRPALKPFEAFLGRIRRRPRLKWLVWLTYSKHTRDVEAMTLNNLGVCRLMLGELWEAEQYFRAALERDARYPLPPFNLANVAYMRGDKEEGDAMLTLSRSLGCDPAAIEALVNRSGGLLASNEQAPSAPTVVADDDATSPAGAPSTPR